MREDQERTELIIRGGAGERLSPDLFFLPSAGGFSDDGRGRVRWVVRPRVPQSDIATPHRMWQTSSSADFLLKRGLASRTDEGARRPSRPESGETDGGVRQLSTSTRFSADGDRNFQVLWEDGDRVFCRAMAPGCRWQPARRAGRASRRGASDSGDPGSPGARIWVEGRVGRNLGDATVGVRPRPRPAHAGAGGSGWRAARPVARRADGGWTLLAPCHWHHGRLGQGPSGWALPQPSD